MRLALLAAVLVPSVAPSIALAGPVTAGLSLGAIQSKVDADGEHTKTLGLFGRLGFSKRVSGQLEVAKLATDDEYSYSTTTIRRATALVVADLKHGGELMPVLFAGVGIDSASNDYETTKGSHLEGGVGLEYRGKGGLTLGLDFRLGVRSVDEPEYRYDALPAGAPESCVDQRCVDPGLTYAPATQLREGEYRTLRLSLGIRF